MGNTQNNFVRKLRKWRKLRDLTQAGAAEYLRSQGIDLSDRTYQNWETGAAMPHSTTLAEVDEVIGRGGRKTSENNNNNNQSDLFEQPPVFGDNKLPRGTIQVFMQDGVVVGYIALSSEFVWLKPESVEADALAKAVEVDTTGKAKFKA